MALWASAFVATKIALVEVSPFFLIFSRLAVGSVFFIVFWMIRGVGKIVLRDRWMLLMLSIFEPCLYFLFETFALLHTTASQAGVVFAFLPIMILVLSRFFMKEKIKTVQVWGGVFAVAGVLVLSFSSIVDEALGSSIFGNVLEFLAVGSAAAYTIMLKRLSKSCSPYFLASVQCFSGSIFFLPFAMHDVWSGVSFGFLTGVAVVYLGVVVTVGAYTLFNFGVAKVSVNMAGMYYNLIPVFVIIFSAVVLDEKIGYVQIFSMSLVIFGVLLASVRPQDVVTETNLGIEEGR